MAFSLAVDTALSAASVAVASEDGVLASRTEVMDRGHQERLGGLVREVLAEAGVSPAAISRVGVVVGPGSFTGVRVGVGFAKGFALGAQALCVGVSTLEALARSANRSHPVVCVIDAGRAQVYMQGFDPLGPTGPAACLSIDQALQRLAGLGGHEIIGPAGALLGAQGGDGAARRPDPGVVACFALAANPDLYPPRPMYLRAADAKTLAERGRA